MLLNQLSLLEEKHVWAFQTFKMGGFQNYFVLGIMTPPTPKKKQAEFFSVFKVKAYMEHVRKSRKASRLRSIENWYTLKKGQPNPANQFNCSSTMCAKRR